MIGRGSSSVTWRVSRAVMNSFAPPGRSRCPSPSSFCAGVTRAGLWAACAHTGNLAGADTAYAAAFKRAGIIRAENLDSVFDWAMAFSSQPLPRGDRVAVITNAGGPGVMAADAVERSGLRLAKLDGQAVKKLKSELPPTASLFNPIDVLGDANPKRYAAAVGASQQDESVDATIVILTPHAMTRPAETIQAIAVQTQGDVRGPTTEDRGRTEAGAVRGDPSSAVCPPSSGIGGKPLLLVFLGEPNGELKGDHHLPVYSTPERAVAALHHAGVSAVPHAAGLRGHALSGESPPGRADHHLPPAGESRPDRGSPSQGDPAGL